MDEPEYLKHPRQAAEKCAAILALPMPESADMFGSAGLFNPWDLFPSLYGSYNSEFDEMAIEVLCDILDRNKPGRRQDLAAEMFREMLCTASLCDYGTSPRTCFPTMEFAKILPDLIEKWRAWSARFWEA